jgi:RNA polymerase sigma-32 factor
MKQNFKTDAAAADNATHRETLSPSEVSAMASRLNVKREEVLEMETRLSGGDVMLDPGPADDGDEGFGPIAYLADATQEPTAQLESQQRDRLSSEGITTALEALDDRSRRIVEERWLKVNDDGSGGMTLHDLAAVYGVSAERIRQIEVAAMKKMKKALVEYA